MKTIEEAACRFANDLIPESNEKSFEEFEISQLSFAAGVEFAQRWIPVEEELPDNMATVLMRDNGCSPVRSTGLFKDGIFYPDFKVLEHKHVTHWRPIEYK